MMLDEATYCCGQGSDQIDDESSTCSDQGSDQNDEWACYLLRMKERAARTAHIRKPSLLARLHNALVRQLHSDYGPDGRLELCKRDLVRKNKHRPTMLQDALLDQPWISNVLKICVVLLAFVHLLNLI